MPVSTCCAICRPSDGLHGGGLTEIQPQQRQRLTGAFLSVWEGMKKPASYGGLEQVTAGAAMLPKFDDAAALCVLCPGQQVAGDLRAAHIVTFGAVVYDGVRQEFATLRADNISAVLGADGTEGQTRVKIAF